MKVAPIAVSKKRTVMSEELFEAGKKKQRDTQRGSDQKKCYQNKVEKGSEVFHLALINLTPSSSAITYSGYSKAQTKMLSKPFIWHELILITLALSCAATLFKTRGQDSDTIATLID